MTHLINPPPDKRNMQYINLTPSSIPAYRFLTNSSNQLAIQTSIAQDPKLAVIYEAWTQNQHMLSYAKKQEATLFASLQRAGIQKHTDRLSNVILRQPHQGRSPTIRRPPSLKRTPPPSSTSTPKQQPHPLCTEINLTEETSNTVPFIYPCYMADTTCFTCKKPGHFQTHCLHYYCRKCGNSAPGHPSTSCPQDDPPPSTDVYEDVYEDKAWANITGEPHGDH